jgi:hypothetical protein
LEDNLHRRKVQLDKFHHSESLHFFPFLAHELGQLLVRLDQGSIVLALKFLVLDVPPDEPDHVASGGELLSDDVLQDLVAPVHPDDVDMSIIRSSIVTTQTLWFEGLQATRSGFSASNQPSSLVEQARRFFSRHFLSAQLRVGNQLERLSDSCPFSELDPSVIINENETV